MKTPLWFTGLAATTGIQRAGSCLSQSLPVVAPLLTAGIGVGPEQIGAIYALKSFGSILFMAFGEWVWPYLPVATQIAPMAMAQTMWLGRWRQT